MHIKLIGPLKSSGVWVCCHGNCIKIIIPHRVQETVLYHNLLANHIVDSEKLEQPVVLTERYNNTIKIVTYMTFFFSLENVFVENHGLLSGIDIVPRPITQSLKLC